MIRAAVSIGVGSIPNLHPHLKDATLSAKRFAEWSKKHQNCDVVELLTDDDGQSVTAQAILDKVTAIVNMNTVDQLLIYFSGHGIVIGNAEYWLLSGAPENTAAAVNVNGSADLAAYSKIPHVVFFSDACRTAAQGVQMQRITGTSVFPNTSSSGFERCVDLFYATSLGKAAYEIAAVEGRSLPESPFATVLLRALTGTYPDAVVNVAERWLVKPWPLKRCLQRQVPLRLAEVSNDYILTQSPDARISSDPDNHWIASLAQADQKAENLDELVEETDPQGLDLDAPLSDTLVGLALSGSHNLSMIDSLTKHSKRVDGTLTTMAHGQKGGGPAHVRQSGEIAAFILTGPVRISAVHFVGDSYKIQHSTNTIRISGNSQRKRDSHALIELESSVGVLLPIINGMKCSLHFTRSGLFDVNYEAYDVKATPDQLDEVDTLRGIAAEFSAYGRFTMNGKAGDVFARRMQKNKQIAPALGIYAAYAYRNNGRLDRIQEIKTYSRDDLGGMIFDIAMLSGHFRSETDSKLTTFPFASLDLLSPLPLISQGWSYMETQPLIYPFDIKSVQQHILPSSTWTVYTTEAVEILKEHLYNEH